jgi:hypothetical protein
LGGGVTYFDDLRCKDGEFRGEMARAHVAVEICVVDAVIEGAFDEYRAQGTSCDLGGCCIPDELIVALQGYGVGLYVAEDDDLIACVVVAEEEGGAFDRCENRFLLA